MSSMSCQTAWEFARRLLRPGMVIQNWTVASGHVGEDFTVREIGSQSLLVELPKSSTLTISSADFLMVGQRWGDYLARRFPRHALRDSSQRTKYVISILHQLGYY
jgi:hypothetical protein